MDAVLSLAVRALHIDAFPREDQVVFIAVVLQDPDRMRLPEGQDRDLLPVQRQDHLQVVLFFIGGSGAGVFRAVHKDLHAGRRASRAEEYQAEHRCRDGQQGRCRQCFFLHAAHLPRFFSGRLNPITKQPGKQPESRSGKAPPGCPGTPFPACREQSAVFPRFHKRKPGLNGLYAL